MEKLCNKSKSFIKNIKIKFKKLIQKSNNSEHVHYATEEELKTATENALKTYEKYEKFKNSSIKKRGIELKTTKSNQQAITVFTDNGPVTSIPGIEIYNFNNNDFSTTSDYEGIFDDRLYYNVIITKHSSIYYDDNYKPAKVFVTGYSVNPETNEVKFISEQKQGTYHHISAQFKIYAHKYADKKNYDNIKEK